MSESIEAVIPCPECERDYRVLRRLGLPHDEFSCQGEPQRDSVHTLFKVKHTGAKTIKLVADIKRSVGMNGPSEERVRRWKTAWEVVDE